MIKLMIDAMGGDNAPQAIVEGCVAALKDMKDLHLTLFGRKEEIEAILKEMEYEKDRLDIVDAREIIDNNEAPVMAVRRKKDSSVVKALRALADGQGDGFVSAGSTGAVLAGATLIVKRIPGILRPALAPVLPTKAGKGMLLIDCGANVDCKPQYLAQFGVMGSVYMEKVMGTKAPKVALINNGAEEHKGNDLTQKAHQMLKKMPIDFTGNVEARDLVSGETDVAVADGFVGNVVLKFMEGFASALMSMLKTEMTSTLRSKMGAALMMPSLKNFKKKMDYTEYGGAPLLGVNKAIVKAHGSSNSKAFYHAIRQCRQMCTGNVVGIIREEIQALPEGSLEIADV